eukprot:791358-Rhodomonas_salina.1
MCHAPLYTRVHTCHVRLHAHARIREQAQGGSRVSREPKRDKRVARHGHSPHTRPLFAPPAVTPPGPALGSRVWGLGSRVWGLGSRV